MREILEGSEDGTEPALINLDQFKAFNRFDYRFLMTVLETAGFELEFCKWISIMYYNSQVVVQVNGKRSDAFAIKRSVRQCCLLYPLLCVLALEPLCRRLWDEKASPALCSISFVSPLSPKISAYTDGITVFVSHLLNIRAVKKGVERHDMSEGLQQGAWRLAFPCQGIFAVVTDPSASLGCSSGPVVQLERNLSEV